MRKPVMGVLLGDAAGVGPEIIAKVAASGFLTEHCRPVIIGDKRVFERALTLLGLSAGYRLISDVEQADWSKADIHLLDLENVDPAKVDYAEPSAYSGRAINDTLIYSVGLCKQGKIEGFVYAPFNKNAMKQGGCAFEGEQHLIAHHFEWNEPFGEINVLGDMWTTRATSHIPISEVSANLTEEKILRAARLAHSTLLEAGIPDPVIGFAALNPHCGEHGLCGTEEINVIAPAIKKAVEMGIKAAGPFSSDIVFIRAFNGEFNAVVTMYHDQGQIALKLRGFEHGITIAGGLPAPIVTCAHGTAYDIAGTGAVKTTAFENAVKMAVRMANTKHAKLAAAGKEAGV